MDHSARRDVRIPCSQALGLRRFYFLTMPCSEPLPVPSSARPLFICELWLVLLWSLPVKQIRTCADGDLGKSTYPVFVSFSSEAHIENKWHKRKTIFCEARENCYEAQHVCYYTCYSCLWLDQLIAGFRDGVHVKGYTRRREYEDNCCCSIG